MQKVVPIVESFQGYIYSWGRSEDRNFDVGGHSKSRHKDYCAIDAGFYSEWQRDQAYTRCYAEGLHGYKKGPWKETPKAGTEREVWAFHMQDTPAGA